MTQLPSTLPKWILITSGILAIMELMVGISMCLAPHSVFEHVDLGAKGVMYLIYMWAARQFALGIVFGYATLKRSAPMLTITYIFFLVMMLGDLIIGVMQKENAMIISALVMGIISSAILVVLNKRNPE